MLTTLCSQSRMARSKWKEAGSPCDGSLYEEKCKLRQAVRGRVRFCAAQRERSRISRRGRMFETKDNARFHLPGRMGLIDLKWEILS